MRCLHQGCLSDKGHHTAQQVHLLSLTTRSNYAARTDILYFKLRDSQKDLLSKPLPLRSLHFSCSVPVVSENMSHGGLQHSPRNGGNWSIPGPSDQPQFILQ